jgi:4-amino-4-deoxy-L-arabinose transferase-like glycosyltransferase
VLCSIGALLWVVAARMLGPSDAWDQAQPGMIACTSDIVVNGNWILPLIGAAEPATKPPLYNWLAVPLVKLMGFSSELAHKAPSVVAICLCWLIMVRLGRRVDPSGGGVLGWLAAMCLVANYSFFKLGYLARPDMLLALWVLLGWVACTVLLADAAASRETAARPRLTRGGRAGMALAFWVCLGLAGLTKGPAALPLLVYAVAAAPLVGGKWTAFWALRPWWGLPLSLVVFGGWVWAAWRVDPDHVVGQLWGVEVAGRVMGVGPESSGQGPLGVLKTAPFMPLYFLGFFFPWSLFSVAAVVRLWSRPDPGAPRRWRGLGTCGAMLHGAAIFVIATIVLYSLSASKRADYAVVAFAPGALLAAWWLLYAPPRLAVRVPWLVPVAAGIALAVHTAVNELQPNAPQRGFGDAVAGFAREAEAHLRTAPTAPVVFVADRSALLRSYFGAEGNIGARTARALIKERCSFWLFAGRREDSMVPVVNGLRQRPESWSVTEACRSRRLPRSEIWPEQVLLYRIEPMESE